MIRSLKAAILATSLVATGAFAQNIPAPVAAKPGTAKIVRLDCGTMSANDLDAFSDTFAFSGVGKPVTASCYLIKHGDTYLLWDTGLSAALKGKTLDAKLPFDVTLKATIFEQLVTLGVKPEQITLIGISHYHFDHTGQAAAFPGAKLLIGQGDLDALRAGAPGVDAKPLAPWLSGGSKVEGVSGDKDIFGDGSVTMIDLPGHTPGHHGLLVRLAKGGNILLTGDQAHFRENYALNGVPRFNTNRADTLASFDRFKALATNLKATVIIQHDARDIAKLPAFPVWAD